MARSSNSNPLLWIGGSILAAGLVIIAGFWVYGITTAEDIPVLLIAGLFAIPVGVAILLISAIRDRIAQRKRENFLEVDN